MTRDPGPVARDDLLALTTDSLAALANRGLVKRALKDLHAGAAPAVEVDADGTVHGRFPDGVETTLPVRADLRTAPCGCAASGTCRHRICLVLAYQRQFGRTTPECPTPERPAPGRPTSQGTRPGAGRPGEERSPEERPREGTPERPAAFVSWSPGDIADEALTALYGTRARSAARRTHRAGYPARIHRPTPDDPVATADLPSCTVRFLVPGEPGYAHTDAADAARAEMITLAVWAFRQADERGVTDTDITLDVGGPRRCTADVELSAAVAVLDHLLLDGAMHAGTVQDAALRRVARDLDARGLRWPAAAVTDIVAQLTAHRQRAAHYRAERVAELLTEVHARHRAAAHPGGSPRSRVLGSDEPAETPLRRARLISLGCTVGGHDGERTADVFFAHADSGTVLVLRKRWPLGDDEILTGERLATRRIGGAPLASLATGNVVTESATRSASRLMRLSAGRVARTGVTPLGRAWESLPEPLRVRDLPTLDRELGDLPPRLIRPRVEAELVRVVPIADVHDIGYDPGDQRLDAVIADPTGAVATVSAEYQGASPAALDCLAAALGGQHGVPRFVSGSVHRARGGITVRPVAVLTDQGALVPDLAPGDGSAALDAGAQRAPDPLDAALGTALTACADAAHHGLRHLPGTVRARLRDAAAVLTAVGLRTAAVLVTAVASAGTQGDEERTVAAWVDAQLSLITTAELR